MVYNFLVSETTLFVFLLYLFSLFLSLPSVPTGVQEPATSRTVSPPCANNSTSRKGWLPSIQAEWRSRQTPSGSLPAVCVSWTQSVDSVSTGEKKKKKCRGGGTATAERKRVCGGEIPLVPPHLLLLLSDRRRRCLEGWFVLLMSSLFLIIMECFLWNIKTFVWIRPLRFC